MAIHDPNPDGLPRRFAPRNDDSGSGLPREPSLRAKRGNRNDGMGALVIS